MSTRDRGVRLLVVMLLALLVLVPAAAAKPGGYSSGELPLGNPALEDDPDWRRVAPGLTYTRIERGEESRRDFYTVDVAFEEDRGAAREVARQLREDGYEARIEKVAERAPDDPERGPLGYLVRNGSFETQEGADARSNELKAKGYENARTVYTGEDGGKTTGPWVVHVLKVDPDRFGGEVAPELATEIVPERELLTSMSDRNDALAAVNGGYFVIEPEDGTPGDLAGISVLEGDLVSEAVDGRTSLVLPPGSSGGNDDEDEVDEEGEEEGSDGEEGVERGADVAALSDSISARSSDGASRTVDGLNRKPGLIRGCGGDGGDKPTEKPKHDFTCTDGSELILFEPIFGHSTEAGTDGAEAVLDSSGRVVAVREGRGSTIPPNGSVLSGTGGAAGWLRAHAEVGERIRVRTDISADGERLPRGTGVVNGGPRLLAGGEQRITAYREGFHWPEEPEFYYRFGVRRNPRTLAGVTPQGNLLLVAVDGRRPEHSVGASFKESARIMEALGAEEAVNLDGGGSTGMTVRERLVTRPSDTTGERPIGDAVLLLPQR